MDIYKLYRNLWDFAFANPEKLKPNDIAIYSFAVEHCNRLGWKEKFGFPTSMVMEATGIKSYSVYKKHFDNLVDNNFFEVIEYSKNQYSSNIIALQENYKAPIKALDKATAKHITKHTSKQPLSTLQSTHQSNCSIDKQIYNNTNLQVYEETHSEFDQYDEIDLEKSDILKTWLKYKKEKNEEIKSSMQIESIFKNMIDVDIGDLKIIINQTITSGAKNIIWNYANELKQKNKTNEVNHKPFKSRFDTSVEPATPEELKGWEAEFEKNKKRVR